MADRERLSRLTLAVSAAAGRIGTGPPTGSDATLVDSYNRLREEVSSALSADRAEDFDTRFPALAPPDDDQHEQATREEVAERLREMAAWLEEAMST